MYHLIIVSRPEFGSIVIVSGEDDNEVYRENVFTQNLKSVITKTLDTFDINDVCFYGPDKYIDKIAADMKNVCKDINITVEKAGA